VVAQNEQAASLVDQFEHDAEGAGAVRAVIYKVAELDDEAVGGDGVAERGGVAMDIAHDPDAGGQRIRECVHRRTNHTGGAGGLSSTKRGAADIERCG
jgi:hypothetical protein